MIGKIKNFWEKYSIIIVTVSSIVIILVAAIFRIGKKGKYTKLDYFNPFLKNPRLLEKGKRVNSGYPGYEGIQDNFARPLSPSESKSEVKCREILENYFKRPFKKARPDFLRNHITGRHNLELDCYNPGLGLALEYNGKQHYEYTPFFHSTKDAFYNQKYRDDMKRRLCIENGIKLIEVPYTVKYNDLQQYVLQKIKEFGF